LHSTDGFSPIAAPDDHDQRRPGVWSDDPVDPEPATGLKRAYGSVRGRAEDAVDGHVLAVSAKQVLECLHRVLFCTFPDDRPRFDGGSHVCTFSPSSMDVNRATAGLPKAWLDRGAKSFQQ
jgi:hypothetical protein